MEITGPEKKIAFISTGGTIAMRFDPEKGGEVPSADAAELLETIRDGIPSSLRLESIDYGNVPSFHLSPSIMLDLAGTIEEYLDRDDVDGVVLTHGTDTLEETSYFLDLWIDTAKPVCLTGAMRSGSDLSPDGPANILAALRAASCSELRECGTLVVMNGEIHAARLACKLYRTAVHSFSSPGWGPLGRVSSEGITVRWKILPEPKLRSKTPLRAVPIIKSYTGMEPSVFASLLETGLGGLVVEGFGAGNVPPSIVPGIQRLLDENSPVVVTSRVPAGPLLGTYAAEGGGGHLRSLGAILCGELNSQKARIKLMLALGMSRDMGELRQIFTEPQTNYIA